MHKFNNVLINRIQLMEVILNSLMKNVEDLQQ